MARSVWSTDRYGSEVEDPATLDGFTALLDSIVVPDGDDEHAVVGLHNSEEWALEFARDAVTFENVEHDGPVGSLRGASRDDRLAMASEFLAGDFAALRARPWARETGPRPEDAVLSYLRDKLAGALIPGATSVRHTVRWVVAELSRSETRLYRPEGELDSPEGRYDLLEKAPVPQGTIVSLRDVMTRPEGGTWFGAVFELAAGGRMTSSFDFDPPATQA